MHTHTYEKITIGMDIAKFHASCGSFDQKVLHVLNAEHKLGFHASFYKAAKIMAFCSESSLSERMFSYKYLSCGRFFMRRSAAFPGEMPILIELVATGVDEEEGGSGPGVGVSALAMASAAPVMASAKESFDRLTGIPVIIGTRGGLHSHHVYRTESF